MNDMKNIKDYDNYIFDFYGTLVCLWTNERKKYLWCTLAELFRGQKAHYHAGELQKRYLRYCRQVTDRMQRECDHQLIEIDLLEVFDLLYKNKGVTVNKETLKETAVIFRLLSTESVSLFPDAVNLLKWLREHGKKVYLLSNAQAVFTEYEMEQLGISNLFDGILYSSDAGYRKPSERFYGKLLKDYGLDTDDCVMIGNDAHTDIKGAHDMGIDSIYLHTVQSGRHPDKLPDDCREYDSLSVVLSELI